MSEFRFTNESARNDNDNSRPSTYTGMTTTHEFVTEDVSVIIDKFQVFLKVIGVDIGGTLKIVNELEERKKVGPITFDDMDENDDSGVPEWKCRHCDASNNVKVTKCWECGSGRTKPTQADLDETIKWAGAEKELWKLRGTDGTDNDNSKPST